MIFWVLQQLAEWVLLLSTGSQWSAACKPKALNFSPSTQYFSTSSLISPAAVTVCCHCLLWKGKKLLIAVCCCITVVGCCSSIRRLSTFLPRPPSLPANIASGPPHLKLAAKLGSLLLLLLTFHPTPTSLISEKQNDTQCTSKASSYFSSQPH